MPTPEVIERVRKLDEELAETQPDAKIDAHIDSLRKQIDAVLVRPDHLPHYKTLNDKLLNAYVGFEIDHPKLASSIQATMAALAAAGL